MTADKNLSHLFHSYFLLHLTLRSLLCAWDRPSIQGNIKTHPLEDEHNLLSDFHTHRLLGKHGEKTATVKTEYQLLFEVWGLSIIHRLLFTKFIQQLPHRTKYPLSWFTQPSTLVFLKQCTISPGTDYRFGFNDKGSTLCHYLNSTTCGNLLQILPSSGFQLCHSHRRAECKDKMDWPETQPFLS